MEQGAQKKGSLVGQTRKMINFICKKIPDRMEQSQPAFMIPSQPGKHASPLS